MTVRQVAVLAGCGAVGMASAALADALQPTVGSVVAWLIAGLVATGTGAGYVLGGEALRLLLTYWAAKHQPPDTSDTEGHGERR